jgi:hypothetical protein
MDLARLDGQVDALEDRLVLFLELHVKVLDLKHDVLALNAGRGARLAAAPLSGRRRYGWGQRSGRAASSGISRAACRASAREDVRDRTR